MNLFNINLKAWKEKRGSIFIYNNEKQKILHKELIEYSKNGINIDIINERMFAFWHMTIHPGFPYNIKKNNSFKFLSKLFLREQYKNRFNKPITEFYKRICPSIVQMYHLALILMIREGINSEVIRDWKVKLNEQFNYELGDKTSIALLVNGKKCRSNSIQITAISNDSEQKKYIDFFLIWLKPLYKYTNNKDFFQWVGGISNIETYSWKNNSLFFDSASKNEQSIYKKFSIYDINGTKVLKIQHDRLRPYSNYSDYLKGYSEFTRQYKKGHTRIDTQIHYENNAEWKNQNKHKIARTIDLIVGEFTGNIDRNPSTQSLLFEGLFANCKDPSNPTYYGKKVFKKGEFCCDWFKCLTMCNKACVIPKVHGETIYALIEFMNEEKDLFLRNEDWEKEYLLDYQAAENVFNDFTKEEQEYSKKNSYKHRDIVKRKFYKKTKLEGIK